MKAIDKDLIAFRIVSGIVIAIFRNSHRALTLDEVVFFRDQRLVIQQGQAYPLLIVSPHMVSFEPAALDYLKGDEGMVGVTAGAILLKNWALASIARVFLHQSGQVPIQIFYRAEKALDWLREERARKGAPLVLEPGKVMHGGKEGKRRRRAKTGEGKDGLTDRQGEVASLVIDGYTTEEIAALLHIEPKTVEKHRENINRKTGTSSALALRLWWTGLDKPA